MTSVQRKRAWRFVNFLRREPCQMSKVLVNLDPVTGNKWRVNVDGAIKIVGSVVWMDVICTTEKCKALDGENEFFCIAAYNVRTVHCIQDDIMLILPKDD